MNTPITIQHEENDPICLRSSIGGTSEEAFYLTYRGDRKKVLEMLKHVVKHFEAYQQIPELKVKPQFIKTRFGNS